MAWHGSNKKISTNYMKTLHYRVESSLYVVKIIQQFLYSVDMLIWINKGKDITAINKNVLCQGSRLIRNALWRTFSIVLDGQPVHSDRVYGLSVQLCQIGSRVSKIPAKHATLLVISHKIK